MSDEYRRHPFLQGNVDRAVYAQPEIRGSSAKDSSGDFPTLPNPSELRVETETGTVSATFSAGTTMEYVLTQLTSAFSALAAATRPVAEEYEGCLIIRSGAVGDGAYVKILPPASFADASSYLGLPVDPNPTATVRANDPQHAPVRPLKQANPVGTEMMAHGEDRTSAAFNRVADRLLRNQDTLWTWLNKPVIRAQEFEFDNATMSAFLVTNADGTIDQLNLAAFSVDRCWVGDLDRNSPLRDVAEFWGIFDTDYKEILADGRTVRIAAVSRGQRGVGRPTWSDETSAPSSPLSDTSGTAVDGNNALGVDRTKHASVGITEVKQNTIIVCSGATFSTSGVRAGDIATIASATVDNPFNHNGTHIVETVIDEETLVLRPNHDNDNVRALNPDTSGSFGSVTITSGGEWEQDLWVTFDPPIPRLPADSKFRVVLPVETTMSALAEQAIADGLRSREEVSGWLMNFWRQTSFEGVYQGAGAVGGGGYRARLTKRGVTFISERTEPVSAGTSDRTQSANATFDKATLELTLGVGDEFTTADLGRTIWLTGLTGDANITGAAEPWTIVEYIDARTARLAPPIFNSGYEAASGTDTVTAWDIVDGETIELPSIIKMVSPEDYGAGPAAAARPGAVYIREHKTDSGTDAPLPGIFSFLHLERIKLYGAAASNMLLVTTTGAGNGYFESAVDFGRTYNIYAENGGDRRSANHMGGVTLCRVLTGSMAGVYRVYQTQSVGTNTVWLRNLDGSTPDFTGESGVLISFYNAVFSVGTTLSGIDGNSAQEKASLSLFADAQEMDSALATALRAGWRGTGHAILIGANDQEFTAYDDGDGATGSAIRLVLYAPANGIEIDAKAADSGADDRKSIYGLIIRATSHRHVSPTSLSGNQTTTLGQSAGGWVHAGGSDPALVLTQTDGTSTLPDTEDSRLTPSATVIVGKGDVGGSSQGQTGLGSAIETRGSIYVHRFDPSNSFIPAEPWAGGGVFAEDVVGGGRVVQPMLGFAMDSTTYPNYGTDPDAIGWDGPVRLGQPGIMLPALSTDADPSANLEVSDTDVFNMPHSGILAMDDGDVPKPYSQYIGQRVKITEAGHPNLDQEFVILSMRDVGGLKPVKFALYRAATTLAAYTAADFQVLGQRWWAGFSDVASYTHIGTIVESSRHLLPVLTLGSVPTQVTPGDIAEDTLDVSALGLLSLPPAAPAAAGVGIGIATDLASMTNLSDPGEQVGSSTYGWQSASLLGAVWIESSWTLDALEGRNPFYAPHFIRNNNKDNWTGNNWPTLLAGASGGDVPGNLTSQDYALEIVSQTSADGVFATWDDEFGGCMLVGSHPDNASSGTETARVWQRGENGFNEKTYALRARFKFAMPNNDGDITLALRKPDGTAIVSDTTAVTAAATVQEIEVEWTGHDLLEAFQDDLDGTDVTVSLTADIEVTEQDSAACYIIEMRIDEIARPAKVKHGIEVDGIVGARGFYRKTPGLGFQSVGPANVDLMENDPWGRLPGSTDTGAAASEFTYGTHEAKGLGLVKNSSGSWMQPRFDRHAFFRKGIHSAAIRMFHPYYDPLWYWQFAVAEHTAPTVTADGLLSVADLPGRTGFIIPFDDVPHGAYLTSLDWAMDIQPAVDRSASTSSYVRHWGIYRRMPWHATGAVPDDAATWQPYSNWSSHTGFLVKLWRYNCGPNGTEHYGSWTGSLASSLGLAECIMEHEVDLSGETVPVAAGAGAGANAGSGDDLMYAHAERRALDLVNLVESGADATERQLLRVDRRQFDYFATIEFWGGPRGVDSSDDMFASPSGSSTTPWARATINSGFDVMYGRHADHPDTNGVNVSPPVVRYRGMRLGWLSDRVAHGGW